jgi:hypothetical protein
MATFTLPHHVHKFFFYGWVTATPLTEEELLNARNAYLVSGITAILILGVLAVTVFRCLSIIYHYKRKR